MTWVRFWASATAVAIVAGAWWLRDPGIRYLVVASAATVVAMVAVLRLPRRARQWAAAAAGASAIFCVLAGVAQRDLWRIERHWPAYRAALLARGHERLAGELERTALALRAGAREAAAGRTDPGGAFPALARAVRGHPERGIVLYRDAEPVAWGGRVPVSTDALVAPLGVARSPFYVVLYAAVVQGPVRAVATAVIAADPPGDRLVHAVANGVARGVGLHAFESLEPGRSGAARDAVLFAPGGDTLFAARAVAPGPEEARLLTLERVRWIGALLVAAAILLFLVAAWRGERSLRWRLAPLAVVLVALALAPLSAFSSSSVLFDPTVYYATLGGPLTANVGALGLAAAVLLLALLLAIRARPRIASRRTLLAVVLAVIGGGPFLLRALSRGVSPPPGGITTAVWLAWEVALFLAAATLLVAAAAAGSSLVGRVRGLPPVIAPAVAAVAALLGPVVLQAPGVWPPWYTALWIVAIGALAVTRPYRRLALVAATVAALGATTLTWNAGVRGRAALANQDVEGLGVVQPDVMAVLQRLGDISQGEAIPHTEADLVRLYMQSDLVGSGYPVALASWRPDGVPAADVALDPITIPIADVARAASEARTTHEQVLRPVLGTPGLFALLAVPYADGSVATVLVAPRTRLIPDDPFNALLGLEQREHATPPYGIALVDLDPALRLPPGVTRWYRSGTELHGDRLVQTGRGPRRAHVEIELRSEGVLAQRGTLVVLLDLIVIAALWTLAALPEGALGRWARARLRRWAHSYRARLTVGLFAFFVVPAVAFALWSYQRLQSEDRQSRDLLVRETLRAAMGGEDGQPIDIAEQHGGAPLLLYRWGELRQTNDPLFDALAPVGRFVPAAVYGALREGREVYESRLEQVGDTLALFGYRSAIGPAGETVILASPARGNEDVLDQRRRDLGVLVLFATVLGALAAFWLSRAASQSLAQPIGSLRGAALAVAAGEREPPLARRPPEEFEPVFSAFRRMAADLGESRAALESAQRRTAAVLRNVASGVVAIAPDGTVTLANPRAESLLGARLPAGTPVSAVNAAIGSRVHGFLEREAEEEELETTLGERQIQARLTRLDAASGGAVLTLDDVTELARVQRVLAWGEMARQVAHEIKNPLTPIRLGVQHLKRAYADARGDFDEILERNAERILAEIDRLDAIARSFSRYGTAPDAGAAPEPVDVAAVARDVMELERLGRSDEVEWRLDAPEGPVQALARADELHEVLLNVLENARLADARRVELRVVPVDGRVRVEVLDDGRGIPAAVLPRIFEPHFSTRTSGSGLGLAISRRLVEGWGGAIAIASVEGEGTVVRVELVRA